MMSKLQFVLPRPVGGGEALVYKMRRDRVTHSKACVRSRRGTVAVLTALALTVILGMAALAIDMSWLVSARDQLQAGVDNTAMSTAHYIAFQPYPQTNGERTILSGFATTYGVNFMHENPVEAQPLYGSSVQTGNAIWSGGRVTGFTYSPGDFDAVRVITNMSGNNPELPAFFGFIFGKQSYQPTAGAIALLKPNKGAILPFTVYRPLVSDMFDWTIADGYLDPDLDIVHLEPIIYQDNYSWNAAQESVAPGQDGIPEIKIYPSRNNSFCSGNFGALNIFVGNEGNPPFEAQIENGVTVAEIESEIQDDGWGGPFNPEMSTYPWPSAAMPTYQFGRATFDFIGMTGNPGIGGNSITASLNQRIGTIVAFFVHEACALNGANGTYTIGELRFARLMDFRLTGNPSARFIAVQPVPLPPNLQLDGWYTVLGMGK